VDKFLIVRKSENIHTGPIMVTTSPRVTCPFECPLRRSASTPTAAVCYAEHGALGGFVWTLLDRLPVGGSYQNGNIKVYGFGELLFRIRALPPGSLWRHNIAGDLISNNRTTIDTVALKLLVEANRGRRGFTFTHFDVLTNLVNREAVRHANKNGFTINLSANSLAHADELLDLGLAPVTVILPSYVDANTTTPKGRTVVICPTYTAEGVTCATCGLCARQRSTVVGFPAIGGKQHLVTGEENGGQHKATAAR
jgi:hypothetical protein